MKSYISTPTSSLRLLLGVIILFALIACSNKQQEQVLPLELKIDVSSDLPSDSVWYIHTYGRSEVQVDTLLAQRHRLKWQHTLDRDSIDALLIYDAEMKLVAPLYPTFQGKQFTITRKEDAPITVSECLNASTVEAWMNIRLISSDTLQYQHQIDSLLSTFKPGVVAATLSSYLIYHNTDTNIPIAHLEAARRYVYSEHEKLRLLGLDFDKLMMIMGSESARVPRDVPGSSDLSLRDFARKGNVIVIQYLNLHGADSAAIAAHNAVRKQIDSLKYPSITVLPEILQLPKGWKSTSLAGTFKGIRHLILHDSVGTASAYCEHSSISTLPTYIVCDSLGRNTIQYHSSDSLIHYLTTLKKVK